MPRDWLNIKQDLSAHLVKMIASDDSLAFALVSSMECEAFKTLTSIPIAIEALYLIGGMKSSAGLRDPVRFSSLRDLKLIMLGTGSEPRARGLRHELEVMAKQQGIPLNIAYEMQSVTAVQDLIERDIGFGILPFDAVRRRVEERALKAFRIVDPEVCREIRLVRSSARVLSAADSAVMKGILRLAIEETRKGLSPLRRVPLSRDSLSSDLKSLKLTAEASAE